MMAEIESKARLERHSGPVNLFARLRPGGLVLFHRWDAQMERRIARSFGTEEIVRDFIANFAPDVKWPWS